MSELLKEWFSPKELLDLSLREMPGTRQGWEHLIGREGWDDRADDAGRALSRPRSGRGGGREFHWSLLPSFARAELVRRGIVVERVADPQPSIDAKAAPDARWAAASTSARERARRRHQIVTEVLALVEGGITQDHAITMVLRHHDAARSTVFNWLATVCGEPKHSWLALLLDDMKSGGRKAEIPAELWQFYESWWLRQAKPTHADSYRRTQKEAQRLGLLIIPSAKTFIRRAEEIPPEIVALKRGGAETTRLLVPAIERTVAHRALLAVSDPEEIPPPKIVRPVRTRGALAVAPSREAEAAPSVEPGFMERLGVAVERRLRLIENE